MRVELSAASHPIPTPYRFLPQVSVILVPDLECPAIVVAGTKYVLVRQEQTDAEHARTARQIRDHLRRRSARRP